MKTRVESVETTGSPRCEAPFAPRPSCRPCSRSPIRARDGDDPQRRHLAGFTELVGTAIANAQARAELTASRARVATADQTRRRIERGPHDEAQQRLVSLALKPRAAQASAPAELAELQAELDPSPPGSRAPSRSCGTSPPVFTPRPVVDDARRGLGLTRGVNSCAPRRCQRTVRGSGSARLGPRPRRT